MRHPRPTTRKETIIDEPLQPLLTMTDMCTLLNLSRPKIYDLMREGLPVIRFGKAVRFSPTSLRRWLARREEIA